MKKILLAERDAFLVGVYANELRKHDFNVSIVRDEKIILDRIKDLNPDLLIMDVCLPETKGHEIIKKLKDTPEMKELKIVMLSCFGSPEGFEEFTSMPGIKYFSKAESTAEELIQEIKKILD